MSSATSPAAEVQHKFSNDGRAPSLFDRTSQNMVAVMAILDGLPPAATLEGKQAGERMQRYLRLAADQQGGSVGSHPRASYASAHASAVRGA
jgi:hypothetical protein